MTWIIGSFEDSFKQTYLDIELEMIEDKESGGCIAKPKYEADREAFNLMVGLLQKKFEDE